MKVGYHASCEQFSPSDLLRYAVLAEKAGFAHAMASDHFKPFSLRQGESGLVWSWLGAALSRTSLSFGTVNAPGQRYHPAIVAQGIATLAEMFPGRFWVALGSGQFLNEHITAKDWPSREERNQRLLESVRAIRALLAGESVTHHGLVSLESARLFTLPAVQPLLFGAALSPETAAWLASWADGMITVSMPPKELVEVVRAFRENGGEAKPLYLQCQVSFDPSYEEALAGAADQWRMSVLPADVVKDTPDPAEIDRLSEGVAAEEVAQRVRVSSDPAQFRDWLEKDRTLGFDRVYVHNVNRHQEQFIEVFGRQVLPHFA